jgi:hypothetical protein
MLGMLHDGKAATDETRMKHGLKENNIRVSSVRIPGSEATFYGPESGSRVRARRFTLAWPGRVGM